MEFPANLLTCYTLPQGFRFSQSSLQDYVDCQRRFQLRYLQNLAWPALQTEPALENERFMQRGKQFHRLTHQFLLGVPVERLSATIDNDDLRTWWEHFLIFAQRSGLNQSSALHPEMGVSASLGEHSLFGQFDLIARNNQYRWIIYDWKTSHRRPRRNWLAQRLQTRLYPYLFVYAGASLNTGVSIEPQTVELVYWFAAFPDQPERFPYNLIEFERDATYLSSLIDEIANLKQDQFALTTHHERCTYCVYRSLCNRGEQAGCMDEAPDDLEPEEVWVDFEQIVDIEF